MVRDLGDGADGAGRGGLGSGSSGHDDTLRAQGRPSLQEVTLLLGTGLGTMRLETARDRSRDDVGWISGPVSGRYSNILAINQR